MALKPLNSSNLEQLALKGLTTQCVVCYHGREIGDARQRRVNGELERDSRQQQNERQVKSILWLLDVHRVRRERHTSNEELRRQTTPRYINRYT